MLSELVPFIEVSAQWPNQRYAHSSVLINTALSGPHLLTIGGENSVTNDCWLFHINKRIWSPIVRLMLFM